MFGEDFGDVVSGGDGGEGEEDGRRHGQDQAELLHCGLERESARVLERESGRSRRRQVQRRVVRRRAKVKRGVRSA